MYDSKFIFTFLHATRLNLCEPHKSVTKLNMEEEDHQCALCLDFFTGPVRMTNCGHNFCQQCLIGMVELPWMCPECRKEQHQQPEQLARNFYLEKIVEKFIESRKNICRTHNLQKKLREYFRQFISNDISSTVLH